jgi:uncharacterized RDD family membrane protein YckC
LSIRIQKFDPIIKINQNIRIMVTPKNNFLEGREYANFGLRLLAYLIDYAILFTCIYIVSQVLSLVILLFTFLGALGSGSGDTEVSTGAMAGVFLGLIAYVILTVLASTVISWLYYAFSESSVWQATVGKRVLNLKVTDLQGGRITFIRATRKYFGSWLSSLILGIGYLFPLWTDKKQTLHDLMAGTVVTKPTTTN